MAPTAPIPSPSSRGPTTARSSGPRGTAVPTARGLSSASPSCAPRRSRRSSTASPAVRMAAAPVAGGDTADCPASADVAAGCGVVFELKLHRGAWTESVLHSFTGAADGGYPYAGVTEDDAGRLFGTTSAGGSTANCPATASFAAGCGVVYQLSTPDAFGVRPLGVIYTFSGGADGRAPLSPLTLRPGHTLFGATYAGGLDAAGCDAAGCGTDFVIASALSRGVVKKGIVWSFTGGGDGANPSSELGFHDHGEIFGTAEAGGANGAGVAYRIPK